MTETFHEPQVTEIIVGGRKIAVFELKGKYDHKRLLEFFISYKQQAELDHNQLAVIDIRGAVISANINTVLAGQAVQQIYAAQVVIGADANPAAKVLINTLEVFRSLSDVVGIARTAAQTASQLAAGKKPIYLVPRSLNHAGESSVGAATRHVEAILKAAGAEG